MKNSQPTADSTNNCYLLFSTTQSLLSRSIRLATGCEVSHAAIAYECSTTGRVMVLEASGSGFRGLTWENWIKENELIHAFRLDVPVAQWQGALGGFCDTLGTPYDSRRLVLELARHLSRDWTQRFSWANTVANSRGVLCADAVADFLFRVGFAQFKCPPAWTPRLLLEQVMEDSHFARVSKTLASAQAKPFAAAVKQERTNTNTNTNTVPYLRAVA